MKNIEFEQLMLMLCRLRPSFMSNMETKENADEDVKRNFLSFSALGNPQRLLLFSRFFLSTGKSSHSFSLSLSLFFFLFLFLFLSKYLASYPSFYSFFSAGSSFFFFSRRARRRWENLISLLFLCLSKKKKRMLLLLSYRLDNLFLFRRKKKKKFLFIEQLT